MSSKIVPFFAAPPRDLRRVECPSCGKLTTVFCIAGYEPFAVDDDGVVHAMRCSLVRTEICALHSEMRKRETAYDALLLLSAPRFRENLI